MPQLKHIDMSQSRRYLGILTAVLALAGCTTLLPPPAPPQSCLDVEASANLNQFEGQPHVVVLYFFALQSQTGFLDGDLRRYVNGEKPGGMIGEPWQATVLPGQRTELKQQLPRDTPYVGVVADFYRKASGAVLEPSCGMFGGDKIVLSATDLQLIN
jgi:type VI secretion system VasD/TssJ family lipoprotein